MKKLVKAVSARLDTYWYAGKIGETFWVTEYSGDLYQLCSGDATYSWIDIADCQEVIEGKEYLIGINEARAVQKSGNVFANRPTSFGCLDLPDDFMKAYINYLDNKDAFNAVLRKYEFKEI